MKPRHEAPGERIQEDLLVQPLGRPVDFVANLSYLDFGHFRAGTNVVQLFVRFQPDFLPNDTGRLWHFSEKWPDTTCLVELAKVQSYKTGHKRREAFVLTNRMLIVNTEAIS